MLRKFSVAVASLGLLAGLTACGPSGASDDPDAPLKVAATPVPHSEILQFVKDELAADAGLELEIVTFNDYNQPNTALVEQQVTANYFQTMPFLEEFEKKAGDDLEWVAPVHLEPLGVYSEKVEDLNAVPQGATVAVPNDPANQGRALKLLADNGLFTLKPDAPTSATEQDIADNPKELEIKPLEAAQLPRSLPDVDLAVINGNFAIEAGLTPKDDALAAEEAEGNPYANGVVTLPEDKDDPRVRKLVELLQGPEVAKFVEGKYDGSVLIATGKAPATS
ncbi:MetQ/NlpA family ABC transporter substrate-binding protein [Actinomadura sp. WMMB 499]|uniref:MetQ/NlpA family ABC transporter substrate-binding protein n=1 Tax=Actinomadura sp. WMMB 499 TaxID=1219491 RepID=UPI0012480500|nr:MetQ/NlpA family ABC transporter substrate-binding protein [Actinomadura sp. WMMB 499]QFG20969.1 ABC transporter substrate-binding protein [Actinomadura sp. WMMB 499]